MTVLTRRHMLAAAGTTAAGLSLAGADDGAGRAASFVDAHAHIWTSDTRTFPLQPGITAADLVPRSFDERELMEVAGPQGVRRVVLIQHTVFHGFDNSYLIHAWRKHPDRFRVVGMIDDLRPHCGRAMRQLKSQGVTGFRITPRPGIRDWLRTDGMEEMWATAAETRQPMCCLIDPDQLPAVDAACQRHPDTPVVIDHFARIGIDGVIRETDIRQLCRLARRPHVKVKISAYYALGKKRAPHTELVPMIRRLYDAFGPHRLMWASDSPYQIGEFSTYASSIALIRDHIDFVTDEERTRLLRTTAEETFFFI